MNPVSSSHKDQAGFTIIELLIATTVLSIILLLSTVIMISIGSLYYKGINQTQVQDNVRAITDDLSQHLELTGGTPTFSPAVGTPGAVTLSSASQPVNIICVGNTRYTYILHTQINHSYPGIPGQIYHILWRDNPNGTCDPTQNPAALDSPSLTNGTELIAPNSRLVNLTVSNTSPYTITVTVAYGDDDLLCSLMAPGSQCSLSTASPMPSADYLYPDLGCKGNAGDQYCAANSLTTTVVQRL